MVVTSFPRVHLHDNYLHVKFRIVLHEVPSILYNSALYAALVMNQTLPTCGRDHFEQERSDMPKDTKTITLWPAIDYAASPAHDLYGFTVYPTGSQTGDICRAFEDKVVKSTRRRPGAERQVTEKRD